MRSIHDELAESVLPSAQDVWTKTFFQAIQPEHVKITPSEWADEHRVLSSKASSEPGRWRTSRTPYVKEPLDSLGPQCKATTIVLMWASQVAKTETGLNWIGYVMDVAPGPMLMVQPNEAMIKKVVRQRLDPAINETPRLREKVSENKGRDSSNNLFTKDFPGGQLIMAGANAPAGLASMPIRYLFGDEIDRWPGDVGGEGDPVELAEARTRTFPNAKRFYTSTPTEKGHSRIETAFEESDQRHYYVPCPHCAHMQTLRFGNLHWDIDDRAMLIEGSVYYQCEGCGTLLRNHEKQKMLAAGEWRPHRPDVKDTRGYFLNSLYSPFESYGWVQIVKDFLRTKKKPSRLKTFVNTVLAETWQEKGDAPDWENLYNRREDYPIGTLPRGVLFVTAGVDIQRDRIECEVKGWGRNYENWSIEYHVFKGDTSKQDVWKNLWDMLPHKFPHADGGELPIAMMAVDSSDQTMMVYDQVRKCNDPRVLAIKGKDLSAVTVGQPKEVDINIEGKRIYRGIKFWPVGVSLIKMELYGWWRQRVPKPGESVPFGFSHWPEYPEEYFKQATAETRVPKVVNGRTIMRWDKRYDRNEALDVNVYNRAAAFVFGMDRFKDEHWKQLEFNLALTRETPNINNTPPPKKRGPNPLTGKKKWL